MERSSHRHKRSPIPRRRSRHRHTSREHDEYLHLESSSHRHKRHHTPRRRRREDRHYQSSSGYDDYPQQESSPFRHKRRHTPRRKRMDEEHYQDSQGYEPYDYQYHEELIGHHNEAIAPGNRHGAYRKVSLMREQQFSEHKSNSQNMCMGDMRYCACNLCIEGRWRLEGQHHFPSGYRYSSFSGVDCHDDDAYYRHSRLWGDNRRPQTMDDDFIVKTRNLPGVITQHEHQKNDMSSGRRVESLDEVWSRLIAWLRREEENQMGRNRAKSRTDPDKIPSPKKTMNDEKNGQESPKEDGLHQNARGKREDLCGTSMEVADVDTGHFTENQEGKKEAIVTGENHELHQREEEDGNSQCDKEEITMKLMTWIGAHSGKETMEQQTRMNMIKKMKTYIMNHGQCLIGLYLNCSLRHRIWPGRSTEADKGMWCIL